MSRTHTRRSPVLNHLETLLFTVSALFLAWWLFSVAQSAIYQRVSNQRLAEALNAPGDDEPFRAHAARAEAMASGLIGKIEIERLDLSAIIAEGEEEETLKRAVGHVTRTAFPGEPGNVGLAGHRDSFFRGLKDVSPLDTIRITTPDGTFLYQVDTTLIVTPDRGDLLDSTATPSVTLVTCYPFQYWGKAPKRFVVHGRQIGTGSAARENATP